MFELLSKKPVSTPGLRIVGGPTGSIAQWPISYVSEVSGVVSILIDSVLLWLKQKGLLAALTVNEVLDHQQYIFTRRLAGDAELHVLLYSRVYDVTSKKIDLMDGSYLQAAPLPHPRSSSALAYLRPTLYWHDAVDGWLQ